MIRPEHLLWFPISYMMLSFDRRGVCTNGGEKLKRARLNISVNSDIRRRLNISVYSDIRSGKLWLRLSLREKMVKAQQRFLIYKGFLIYTF